MQTLLMQKITHWRPAYRVKNCIAVINADFSKLEILSPSCNQGRLRLFDDFFFEEFDFWRTMRSCDAIKLSTDSLEVSWQNFNIFVEFLIRFSIFMHGYANIVDAENNPLAACIQGEKLHHYEKKSIFKVRDTSTMM